MKILVDNVLGNQPAPSWLASVINAFSLDDEFLVQRPKFLLFSLGAPGDNSGNRV